MAVLKHAYLEVNDNSTNAHKYYLAVLVQEGSTYKTLAYFGRISSAPTPQVTSKYSGPSLSKAQEEFSKVVYEKSNKRASAGPSYEPATMPYYFTHEIARLNGPAASAPAPTRNASATSKRTPAPAPRAPSAPFPLPDIVLPRPVDSATFAAALASPAYVATSADATERVFLVIPARGKAQLVARERFPNPDSLGRFPNLVASLDPANPVLADSILAGDVLGRGASLRLWDLLTYRGNDLRSFPLAERLSLLYQAFDELGREGQLSPAWSLAECLTGMPKNALAAKGGAIVLRSLAAAYNSADPSAALRRA